MHVFYVPEVAGDLKLARDWYESRANGLGEDFLRMAYSAFSELNDFPCKYEAVYNSVRRIVLRRFPYSVYYRVEHDGVTVYGVFHSSRDPMLIKQLLNIR